MSKLICFLIGHNVKFSNEHTMYVGYCKRCEHSIFEKRKKTRWRDQHLDDRGEVVIGILALAIFLGAAVSDGLKNDIEYRNKQREEVEIYENP